MKITDSIKIDWHHDVPNKTTSCVLTVTEKTGQYVFSKRVCCHLKVWSWGPI